MTRPHCTSVSTHFAAKAELVPLAHTPTDMNASPTYSPQEAQNSFIDVKAVLDSACKGSDVTLTPRMNLATWFAESVEGKLNESTMLWIWAQPAGKQLRKGMEQAFPKPLSPSAQSDAAGAADVLREACEQLTRLGSGALSGCKTWSTTDPSGRWAIEMNSEALPSSLPVFRGNPSDEGALEFRIEISYKTDAEVDKPDVDAPSDLAMRDENNKSGNQGIAQEES